MPARLVWAALAVAASAACGDNTNPADHLVAKTTQLVRYDSCAALESDLEALLLREIEAHIDQSRSWGRGDGASEDSGGDAPPQAPGREEGRDYSGTNNQEQGVDEADIVKTDGYHIYVINGRRLHVFGVPTFGTLVPESVTEIEGYPREMLVDRDAGRTVVFSMIDATSLPEGHPLRAELGDPGDYGWYWRSTEVSKITVLDTSDPAHPTLVREVFFEGYYQTARKVDASVRLSAYSWLNAPIQWQWWDLWERTGHDKGLTLALARNVIEDMTLADFVPQLYVRTPDGRLTSQSLSDGACQSFYRPTDSHARGVATLISFDLLGETLSFDSDQVLSNYATFYASTDTLVLTEAAHDWWWYWEWEDDPEQLNVHAFDISEPGVTRYVGSGRVEGTLFDPFSIDEHEGNIRLATTTGRWNRWWNEDAPPSTNHVWVLEPRGGALEQIGHLGGLAPNESIQSARLVGDKGFLVTFERVDPLFTLDLSDPRNPRAVGELKVPGFSTYLHPIADDRLLSIGVGGDDNGANWKTQISLFDVGDFANPTLAATLPIDLEGQWGWSEAQWEHKAFQYWAPAKLLAVPYSSYRYVGPGREGYGEYRYLSRLQLVTVDTDGLARKGVIDHSDYYNEDPSHYWSYVDIRRSIFMGDFVYAISDKAITVHRTVDLGRVAAATLPGYVPGDYYWWW